MDVSPPESSPVKLAARLARKNQLTLALSLLIGAVVGLAVVAFIVLTGRLALRMYPAGGAGWRRLLVPVLGSVSTGYLLWRYFPFARGSGIPQTKFALFVADGRITMRTVLGKFFLCSASLASGIALGREGPSVQVGAGLASVIGRKLKLNAEQVKSLVPVGCSAALAAAFNAPIAAVLFSLEEIMGDLNAPVLGSVVIASATSWMVLHLLLGDAPLFHVPSYQLVSPYEFGIYAALGVVGGLASVVFVKLLLGLRAWFMRLPRSTVWIQPAVGGLTVGVMGYFLPQVLGVGYNYVDQVLNGNMVVKVVVLLAVLKLIATPVCYASGNAGGIFGPSLFIGAMIGGAVGSGAHYLFPAHTASPGAYALVGMGAAFAGIIRTPLTSVFMIFEITRDYSIIVPLMISNLIAYFISARLQEEPIYEALATQEGVHLPSAKTRTQSSRMRVSQIMRPVTDVLPAGMPVREALERMRQSPIDVWPVTDNRGLRGMLKRSTLEEAAEKSPTSSVGDLVEAVFAPTTHHAGPSAEEFPHLHPDHSLDVALERIGSSGLGVLPVVSRANLRDLVGVAVLSDVLGAYGILERLPRSR